MQHQRQGAKGALLDEYERAFSDLKSTIAVISTQELTAIVDPDTSDPDCHSARRYAQDLHGQRRIFI